MCELGVVGWIYHNLGAVYQAHLFGNLGSARGESFVVVVVDVCDYCDIGLYHAREAVHLACTRHSGLEYAYG